MKMKVRKLDVDISFTFTLNSSTVIIRQSFASNILCESASENTGECYACIRLTLIYGKIQCSDMFKREVPKEEETERDCVMLRKQSGFLTAVFSY